MDIHWQFPGKIKKKRQFIICKISTEVKSVDYGFRVN